MFLFSLTDEAEKSAADPGPETAVPAPESSEDKPKEDAIEQSPAASAKQSVEEKTDDEGPISNKTSVESLKETNENNSNNADFGQKRGWCLNNLSSPVTENPCTIQNANSFTQTFHGITVFTVSMPADYIMCLTAQH